MQESLNTLFTGLRCPDCFSAIRQRGSDFLETCLCGRDFPMRSGIPLLFPKIHGHLEAKVLQQFESLSSGGHSWVHTHWDRIQAGTRLLKHHRGGARPLSVGCANAAENKRYQALGFEPIAFDIYPSKDTHLVADAHAIPYADASFDVVTCFEVLEHVEEPWVVMREISRVLKPGGTLFVSVAFLKPFHSSFFHMSHWGLLGLMKKNGLEPLEVFGHQYPLLQIYGDIYPLWSRKATVRFYNALDGTGRWLRRSLRRLKTTLSGRERLKWRDPIYGLECEDEISLMRGASIVALARRQELL